MNPYLSNYGIDTQVKGKNSGELDKWNQRTSQSAKDKQKLKGFRMIKDIQTRLNLKDPTIQRATELYN